MSVLRPPPTKEEGLQKYKSALEREPDTSVPLFEASLMAQMVKNLPAMEEIQETWVRSQWLGRSTGGGNGNPL